MTDARMADVTVAVNAMERDVRRYRADRLSPDEERLSLSVLRELVAVRKALERWVTARALRGAAQQQRAS